MKKQNDTEHQLLPMPTIRDDSPVIELFCTKGLKRLLKKGDVLQLQSDEPHMFYFVRSGMLKSYIVYADGRQFTIEIIARNRLYGFSSYTVNLPRPCSCLAVTDCVLYCMDFNSLRPHLSKPEVSMEIFRLLGDNSTFLLNKIYTMSFMNARQRLAFSILHLLEINMDNNCGTAVEFTHQDMADFNNLNRVTVNETMRDFEKMGLISLSYGSFKVLDKAGLIRVVDKEDRRD